MTKYKAEFKDDKFRIWYYMDAFGFLPINFCTIYVVGDKRKANRIIRGLKKENRKYIKKHGLPVAGEIGCGHLNNSNNGRGE